MVAEPINTNENEPIVSIARFIREIPGSHTRERDIRVSEFIVDESYQRNISNAWVNKIIREFDPLLFDKPLVSMRDDGRYAIIDGQHRIEAVKLLHGTNDVYVRCDVVADGISVEQEAAKYLGRNSDIKRNTVAERFRARLRRGEDDAVAIKEIVEDCGFSLSLNGFAGAGQTSALAMIESIYRQSGRETKKNTFQPGPVHLRSVLSLLRDADYTSRPLLGESIASVHHFLNRYESHPNYRRERLVSILKGTSGSDLVHDAQSLSRTMRVNRMIAGAQILHHRFNSRLDDKNKLPGWE